MGHEDPVAWVALWLVAILLSAKVGGELAIRIGQPAVLGELIAGVIIGNLPLLGASALEPLKSDPFIDMFARLGVLLLVFEVGLESTIAQMLKVGWSALLVAVLGVVAPFGLGWLVGAWLRPEQTSYAHAFLGAMLAATSVGITARVLKDLKRSTSIEARIILGAAVIDDVLGLVILAAVTGAIAEAGRGAALMPRRLAWILGKALAFLVISVAAGALLSRRLMAFSSRLRGTGVLLAIGLSLCFFFSWSASAVGLAPIVGAFAAGLILEEAHYRDFALRGERGLEEQVEPISSFLVPIFFVLMGTRVDLRSFGQSGMLALALALVGAAIVGKQACSLGVTQKGVDRLTVGLGMIPRGEVGLIFADMGSRLTIGDERVIDDATFSAAVAMVLITTMITPPALKWSLGRKRAPFADGQKKPQPP